MSRRRVHAAPLALLLALAVPARAEAPLADLPPAETEAIEAAVTAEMARLGIPGLHWPSMTAVPRNAD